MIDPLPHRCEAPTGLTHDPTRHGGLAMRQCPHNAVEDGVFCPAHAIIYQQKPRWRAPWLDEVSLRP